MAALKWHPDKNKSKNAKEVFLKIQNAFDFLKNPVTRKEYDTERAAKQRRADYDQEQKATNSMKRNTFIEELKKREEELKKKEVAKTHKRPKRKENPTPQESTIERLARESQTMIRQKEEEMKAREALLLKQSQPPPPEHMSDDEFANFEAQVLGNM